MKSLLTLFALAAATLALSLDSHIDKFSRDISELAKKSPEPYKIAIIQPSSTESSLAEENRFGGTVQNLLFSSLLKRGENIEVFERMKLAALVEEHALSMSELTLENNSSKTGKIIPVDYLLLGDWTPEESAVSLNLRLVHVESGKVLHSSTAVIDLGENSDFFVVAQNSETANKRDTGSICPASIKEDVRDLLAKEIKSAEQLLMSIPLADSGCRALHFDAVNRLGRAEVVPEQYCNFLIQQLLDKGRIDRDYLALELIRLFAIDGTVTDQEWNRALDLITTSYRPGVYLSSLWLSDTLRTQNVDLLNSRLEQWYSLVKNGEVGGGTPLSIQDGFRASLNGLAYQIYESNLPAEHEVVRNRLLLRAWKLFHTHIEFETLKVQDLRLYAGLFYNMVQRDAKSVGEFNESIVEAVTTFYTNSVDPVFRGENLLMLLRNCETESQNEKLIDDQRARYSWYTQELNRSLEHVIQETFPAIKVEYKRKSAQVYAIAHSIQIENFVPSIDELTSSLTGNSELPVLVHTASMLDAAGVAAAPAEDRVVRMLSRTERMEQSKQVEYLAYHLMRVIANCGFSSDESMDACIHKYVHGSKLEKEQAGKTLVELGKPAWKKAVSKLSADENVETLISVIDLLGTMGNSFGDTGSRLEKFKKKCTDPALLDAIDDALDLL